VYFRCHVVPCASPTLHSSPPPSPSHLPICHLVIYFPYALCTHDSPPARHCTTPATNSSSISSHRRHAAPYPVVTRAKLFAVHSWQSAPETGDGFTGPIPFHMRVIVGPVLQHDTLYRINAFPDRRSFKQARVCRFALCIDTHSKTDLRYTAESGCYKRQYSSTVCDAMPQYPC